MTETPPVAASGAMRGMPAPLRNCSITDFELDFLLDAEGKKVEPETYKCAKILGVEMSRVPLELLRNFCMVHGIYTTPKDATRSNLLVALAKKNMDHVARVDEQNRQLLQSEDEEADEEDGSGVSQSKGTAPEQSNTGSTTNPSKQPNLVILTATLDDVIITQDKDSDGNMVDDENGTRLMIASTIKGLAIRKFKVDELRAFCSRAGIKHRSKNKRDIALLIAYTKQMDSNHELTGAAAKQSTQQKTNMEFRLLNSCFTDQYYEKFVAINRRKTKAQLDTGKAGNNEEYYTGISEMVNDAQNNDIVGELYFPDNEHLLLAITEGLDLTSFKPITWAKAKSYLMAVFKEHELAKARFTKSGSHEKDFYGDGFTKDLAAYYFFLLLEGKPDAYKSVSTLLDDGVFYVAGAPDGDVQSS
jgi:hypothetical protein